MAEADPNLPRPLPAEPATADPAAAEASTKRAGSRRRLFRILGLVLVAAGLALAAWWFLVGQDEVSTDNAYVGADTALVTAQTAAAIVRVPVIETQLVRAGDLLVELDGADARLALADAEAQLASARRRVTGYFAQDRALKAQVASRGADIAAADARVASAEANLVRARVDLGRRQAILASGAVSGDELTSAQNALATAEAALAEARASRAQAAAQVGAAQGSEAVNTALIAGGAAEENPEVRRARAAVDMAKLDLARTRIRAPIAGVIAKKSAQVGQRVAPGAALMTIVPVETAFVDANFKEGQLRAVRIGQKATLTSDLYGGDVVFHGTVIGLGGGTGAAFALIPAQNATGNWIKVVQRLPVRIALKPDELRAHPLRIGLSMTADIDVSDAR